MRSYQIGFGTYVVGVVQQTVYDEVRGFTTQLQIGVKSITTVVTLSCETSF